MRLITFLFHDVYREDPSTSGFRGPAADRYKLTVPEFEGQLRGLASARSDTPILVGDLPPSSAPGTPFVITVDDGGESFYTTVAERLEALGWRAHCFVTTAFVGQRGFLSREQIRGLDQRGHLIGSHSMSHPSRFSACSRGTMLREWGESRRALEDILGHDVTVASVPGGYFSPAVVASAREAGVRVLFTSEPETRVRRVAGCIVIGRFTVRRGCRPGFTAALANLEPVVRAREWTIWNTKKVAKGLLGVAYPRLSAKPWAWKA